MEPFLAWSLFLFLVGAIVAVIEVIVPSGGMLAIVSLGALGGSLYCAYQVSGFALAVVGALEALGIPLLVVLTFKWLPRTSVGQNLMLSPPKPSGPKNSPGDPTGRLVSEHLSLLGAQGRAATMLRPSGTAEFGGKRISVVTNGEMLAEGTTVKVVEVAGNRVVVEAVKA
jgi:membrane-bound serine protease (ClpP class)